MDYDDSIPSIGMYRGIPVDDQQSEARVKAVVEPEIDHVFTIEDIEELDAWAVNPANSPESRRLAFAKAMAILDACIESRSLRPKPITRERLEAAVAGVSSRMWRSSTHYASRLDERGAVERPERLKDDWPLPGRQRALESHPRPPYRVLGAFAGMSPTERSRECRRRQRAGLMTIRVEAGFAVIDMLVAAGLLSSATDFHGETEISKALTTWIANNATSLRRGRS